MIPSWQNNNPLVSIIIPCYNGEDYVSRSIQSALDQTYKNTEIILVDNNSNDNTLRILQDFQMQYPSKIRVSSEDKQGAPAARNKGLKEANGEWIQFLDSDDSIERQKIESQLSQINNNRIGLVVGNYVFSGPDGDVKREANRNYWIGLITSKLGITSANLWRKSILSEVNGFDEQLIYSSDEYDLMFRMMQKKIEVGYDDNFFTTIYFRPESVSKSRDHSRIVLIVNSLISLRLKMRHYLDSLDKYNGVIKNAWELYIYKCLTRLLAISKRDFCRYALIIKRDFYRIYYIKAVTKFILFLFFNGLRQTKEV